jgi:hypothetical protein
MGNFPSENKKEKAGTEKKSDSKIKKNKKDKKEEYIAKYIKDTNDESNENIYYKVKEIENDYNKVENYIQQICLDKNCDDNDDDEKETQENSHENYLKKLKNISLEAQKISIEIKKSLFQEFKKRKTQFKNNDVDPGCINEFSSWCKNNIKSDEQMVEDLCQKYKKENYNKEDFDIFTKLTLIYLKCGLCNEIIELKTCDYNDTFDNKKMYDLAEIRGSNKNVKFWVLPGLFYNGSFFQNGKIHVYAYSNKNKK